MRVSATATGVNKLTRPTESDTNKYIAYDQDVVQTKLQLLKLEIVI